MDNCPVKQSFEVKNSLKIYQDATFCFAKRNRTAKSPGHNMPLRHPAFFLKEN